jgi:ankyrin repeat protein
MQQALLLPSLTCRAYPDLFAAIRADDLTEFQRLSAQLTDFSIRMTFPQGSFYWIFAGHPYLIQICALYAAENCFVFLLEQNCPHDVLDYKSRHLLHYVFAGGSRNIVNRLWQHDSRLTVWHFDDDSVGLAHFAAKFGRLELLHWLDAHDYPLNQTKITSRATPLMWACKEGHTECVSYLLTKGGSVEEQTRGRWTPLHYAVGGSHANVVELLLRDPNIKIDAATDKGLTPFQHAFNKDAAECCSLLIDRGCNWFGGSDYEDDEEEEERDTKHIVIQAAVCTRAHVLNMLFQKTCIMASFGYREFKDFFTTCLSSVNNATIVALCAALEPMVETTFFPVHVAVRELQSARFGDDAIAAVEKLDLLRSSRRHESDPYPSDARQGANSALNWTREPAYSPAVLWEPRTCATANATPPYGAIPGPS